MSPKAKKILAYRSQVVAFFSSQGISPIRKERAREFYRLFGLNPSSEKLRQAYYSLAGYPGFKNWKLDINDDGAEDLFDYRAMSALGELIRIAD